MRVVRQIAQAINLVSDHWWQRIGWWILVGPKLALYVVGIAVGWYVEDDE